MKYQKKKLISIARKIDSTSKLSPQEIDYILNFEARNQDQQKLQILKQVAVPLSLIFGFFLAVFPEVFESFDNNLPYWTNLSPGILRGVDYLWDILGEPVGKASVLYHIPNIILYSFGVLGIKKLFDALDKRSWLDKVLTSQITLRRLLNTGKLKLSLAKGHSILFIGGGDFIAMQFALNHGATNTVTVSNTKPNYTNVWSAYSAYTLYDDLKNVLVNAGGDNAGEYIFFPVKDDQIFLPSEIAYDLSPHKLDILCQNIRTIEREEKWRPRRIIIVGDKYHKSYVRSEDAATIIPRSIDTISLASISSKYSKITVIDPTDIVMQEIIQIANGRKIVFRATKQGILEYKERFYKRLRQNNYKQTKKRGVLTVGYDVFEDQTEQQTLSRKVDDYYPVVLSRNVHDALLRNGYTKSEFIYVPDLVISVLTKKASEQ